MWNTSIQHRDDIDSSSTPQRDESYPENCMTYTIYGLYYKYFKLT